MAISEGEAMAIVERRPQQIAQILEQFKKLMALGKDAFLVVETDDFFVQFYRDKDASSMGIEAISPEVLPPEKQPDAPSIAKLSEFGFAPPEEFPNHTMDYALSGDADFSYLAVLALAVLYDVYHAPENEPLNFEIILA
jgi:hypothetical protein